VHIISDFAVAKIEKPFLFAKKILFLFLDLLKKTLAL